MRLDSRTPVLVGAAAVSQRIDDPERAQEAVALMAGACEAAAADAGDSDLLAAAGAVLTPRGTWPYRDAGRLVAAAIGNRRGRTLLADVGILQTTLIDRAATAIAAGDLDVAIIVGGEAKWRDRCATSAGTSLPTTDDHAATPDELLRPPGMIISPAEIDASLVTAVSHYAMIENARRSADGQSLDDHARVIAELWARFNEVARGNPEAWNRQPMSADDIRRPGAGNRRLAFPYNKWHSSQWNVDQAACLVLCAAGTAASRGIAEDRWVFPHAVVESNAVVPLSQRRQLHRCPGFGIAGGRAMALAGTKPDELAHLDLYSCFPIAVRVQAAELGLDHRRQLTVTGGMSFAGGPLNNYVLQSMAKMTHVMRADPDSMGMVTAVSGMLTKQGVSIWSSRRPKAGYRSVDVSEEVRVATTQVVVANGHAGPATVATYTVLPLDDGPGRGVVIADRPDGTRAIATTGDVEVAAAMVAEEWCGRAIELDADGGFSPL